MTIRTGRMLGGHRVDLAASLDDTLAGEALGGRSARHRAGMRVVRRPVARANDLPVLVADGAARVGAHGAHRRKLAAGLPDQQVWRPVGGITVGGALPWGQGVRGTEPDRARWHVRRVGRLYVPSRRAAVSSLPGCLRGPEHATGAVVAALGERRDAGDP